MDKKDVKNNRVWIKGTPHPATFKRYFERWQDGLVYTSDVETDIVKTYERRSMLCKAKLPKYMIIWDRINNTKHYYTDDYNDLIKQYKEIRQYYFKKLKEDKADEKAIFEPMHCGGE